MSASLNTARAPQFEVRLHRASPLGPIATALVIVAIIYCGYLVIALQVGQTLIHEGADGMRLNAGTWAAFVQTLIVAAALTMPAFAAQQWARDVEDLAGTLDETGAELARAMAVGPPTARARPLWIGFGFGFLGGVAFNAWLITSTDMSVSAYLQSTGLWFAIVSPPLFGLGARAAVQLHYDDRDIAHLVDTHLDVDLANLERLDVYGRLALRGALSWLVMAAIIMLFFIFAAPVFVSLGTLILSLLAGAYVFISTMRPVVRAAAAMRDHALAEVRTRLAEAGASLIAEPISASGSSVTELAAYEAWLKTRPIWPISAPVTQRLALYGLIPVLAWFGAASAELMLSALI